KEIKKVNTVSTTSRTVAAPTSQETKRVERVLNKYGLLKTRSKNGGWNITCPDCQRVVNVLGYQEGSYLAVQGTYTNPTNGSNRKSFTATSYQILEEDYLVKKQILDQTQEQLPQFEQTYQQIKATREQLASHGK
ncbi:4901_t:CDS:2, partial [Ambispora gerdemannii]